MFIPMFLMAHIIDWKNQIYFIPRIIGHNFEKNPKI